MPPAMVAEEGAGPWFLDRLRCPTCSAPLTGAWKEGVLRCAGCAADFPVVGGQLRCLVAASARRAVEVRLRQEVSSWPASLAPPSVDYRGPVGPRTNAWHLGILGRGRPRDVLDWGCGDGAYRAPVEALGHRYLGVDGDGGAADVIADVHSLPLADASLDHAITNAVLEHVANPFVAVAEVARVLRPGGVFSGSVAFLEPYHLGSHFHLAPDGVVHVLSSSGLRVEAMWPEETWTVFDSLARMQGPVSAPSRVVLRLLGGLERFMRRRYVGLREVRSGRWLRRKPPEAYGGELLAITGQVHFLARKA